MLTRHQLNLRQAIGDAMLSGCTGGKYFAQDYSWLQCDPSAPFAIDWDRFPGYIQPHLDKPQSYREIRARGDRSLWWEYNEDFHYMKTPKWWNVSEADVPVLASLLVASLVC